MTEGEKKRAEYGIHRFPKEVIEASRSSPFKSVLPCGLLKFTLHPGTYSFATPQMGCLLFKQGEPLLRELVQWGIESFRRQTTVASHQARTFYFQEYGLEDRQISEIAGYEGMKEALNMGGRRRNSRPDTTAQDEAWYKQQEDAEQMRKTGRKIDPADGFSDQRPRPKKGEQGEGTGAKAGMGECRKASGEKIQVTCPTDRN